MRITRKIHDFYEAIKKYVGSDLDDNMLELYVECLEAVDFSNRTFNSSRDSLLVFTQIDL